MTIEQGGAQKEDVCDILVNACGFLNKWKWPKIDGLFDYKGKLMHTANWDDDFEWHGKRVAVSVMDLRPHLLKRQSLINLVR